MARTLRAGCGLLVLVVAVPASGQSASGGANASVAAGTRVLSQQDAASLALQNADVLLGPLMARVDEEDAPGTLGRLLRNPELRIGDFRSDRLINPLFDDGDYSRALEDTEVGVRWNPPKIAAMGAEQRAQSLRVDARRMDIESARRDIVREAYLLHAEARSLQRRLALAQEQVEISERIHSLLRRRLEAQLSTSLDESLSALDSFDAQTDHRELELEYERTRQRLFSLIGWGPDTADLPLTFPDPTYGSCRASAAAPADMTEQAIALSPNIGRYELESDALDAEKLTEYLRWVPWFSYVQVGVVPGSPVQDPAVHFQLAFELPVLNFRQNELATLNAKRLGRQAKAQSERQRISARVFQAHQELAGQASLVRFYDEVTTPRLAVSEKQIEHALTEGATDPIDMALLRARILRAKRTHLKAELQCERTQIELLTLTTDVAGLVGAADTPGAVSIQPTPTDITPSSEQG